MLKELKQIVIWAVIVLALLIAGKVVEEYRFVKGHQRAMDLLGVPWYVMERASK